MFSTSINWFFCTFMAVAIATGCSGRDSNTGSSTAEPIQEVAPAAAVELGCLLDAGEGAVVALVSGGTRLLAHRAVLAARSPVLQRLLQDAATGEVDVPDVEGPVLRQLLAYLYTLQAPQLPGMASQLLAAAHQYGLPALKADCERQVAAQLTVQTAAATAVLAVTHSSDILKKAAIAYIRAHIFHVMATQDLTDAMRSQPEVMIKVTQLLTQLPAETSSTPPVDSGTFAYPATEPHSNHSSSQIPTTAATTTAAQTVPQTDDDHISLLRSLSPEEKGRRLMEAAKQGAVGELEALLAAGADVAARDSGWVNRTALHWAAREGHEEAARRLLAAGAAVDARDSDQETPLHEAARHGHVAVARLLLYNGAGHSARRSDGWTPLHLAALFGRTEVVATLMAAGADKEVMDDQGRTPLHLAALNGHTEVVATLTAAGADKEARDNVGRTPLDVAREYSEQQVVQLLEGR